MRTGLNPGTMPKTKPGVYEAALAIVTQFGGDKEQKARLKELVKATAESDAATESARLMLESAQKAEASAQKAEASAESQRRVLATETADAEASLLQQRGDIANDRQELDKWAARNKATDSDLNKREVALRRAFAGFTEGE